MPGQCIFKYMWQPPSTTPNNCNPFDQNQRITISLDCIVRYQTDEFEIRWFRENTTGAVEDLGHGDPSESQINMHWWSRYHNNNFFNQQYNSSYLGKYWCQVINTTAMTKLILTSLWWGAMCSLYWLLITTLNQHVLTKQQYRQCIM